MPILLPHEVYYYKILARHLNVKLDFTRLESGVYRWIIKGYCVFYDQSTRSCRIHSEKPLACRIFPLILDLSEFKLMVSLHCNWVKKCFKNIKNISSKNDLVLLFPSEFEALGELITLLHSKESVIAVAVRSSSIEKLLDMLGAECNVIKISKSSIIEDLNLLLLSNCTSEFVEKSLENYSVEFLVEEKITYK